MEKLRTSVLHHTVTPPSVELSGLKQSAAEVQLSARPKAA